MNKIVCNKCGEEKDEDQFQTRRSLYRRHDGSVTRGEPKRIKRCYSCVYKVDREAKSKRTGRPVTPRDFAAIAKAAKEREFLNSINPKLHPYLNQPI